MTDFISLGGSRLVILGFIFLLSAFLGCLPIGAFVRRTYGISPIQSHSSLKSQLRYALSQGLDILKGVLIIALIQAKGADGLAALGADGWTIPGGMSRSLVWLSGLFALVGHCYTPWRMLREGKGVSILLGIGLILSPVATLFGIAGAILAWMDHRDFSIMSLTALLISTLTHLILYPMESYMWVGVFYLYFVLSQFESDMDHLLGIKGVKDIAP